MLETIIDCTDVEGHREDEQRNAVDYWNRRRSRATDERQTDYHHSTDIKLIAFRLLLSSRLYSSVGHYEDVKLESIKKKLFAHRPTVLFSPFGVTILINYINYYAYRALKATSLCKLTFLLILIIF